MIWRQADIAGQLPATGERASVQSFRQIEEPDFQGRAPREFEFGRLRWNERRAVELLSLVRLRVEHLRPAIVLFGPFLFSVARNVGVHELHYATVIVLAAGINYTAIWRRLHSGCAISCINPDEGIKPILRYMLAPAIGLILVAAIPKISIGFL
jgi:hypothetical protein